MSRTPETARNPKAESTRNTLYVLAVIAGFFSYAAFQAKDSGGLGLILAIVTIVLFWWGSKIKTKWGKVGEAGVYKPKY